MKSKVFSLIVFMLAHTAITAQQSPVNWDFSFVEDPEQNHIVLKATIDDSWYLYSGATPEGGPRPTVVVFNQYKNLSLVGELVEDGKLIVEQSELFEIEVRKYKNEVLFIQGVDVSGNKGTIEGTVTFMTCDGQRCMAPKTIPFSIDVNIDQ